MIGLDGCNIVELHVNADYVSPVVFSHLVALEVTQLHIVTECGFHLRLRHSERQTDGAPLVSLDGALHYHIDTCIFRRHHGRCLVEHNGMRIDYVNIKLHRRAKRNTVNTNIVNGDRIGPYGCTFRDVDFNGKDIAFAIKSPV